MRLRRLGGLVTLLTMLGCGTSGITGDYGSDTRDVIPQYDLTDNGSQPEDKGFQYDDSPYLDVSADTYTHDDVLQYDVDGWDVDSPFDIIDVYDFGKDIYNPDDSTVDDTPYAPDEVSDVPYQPDDTPVGDENGVDVIGPCLPTVKACPDSDRDPVTGKCHPLEVFVDFDGYFDICFDFGNSSYEDSHCFFKWNNALAFEPPESPYGSKANCGAEVVAWYYLFNKKGCAYGLNGMTKGIYSDTTKTFEAGDDFPFCVAIEDNLGRVSFDESRVIIEKQ